MLGPVEVEQGVGAEPGVVEHVGGVVERRGAPRREDVVAGRVALAPERRAPGVVERVEGVVAALQPVAEGDGAGVAVAGQVVAGVLVGDVPHRQRRVVGVAGGQAVGQRQGELAVQRRRRAPGLAAARPQGVAVAVDREDLGVGRGEPGRRRGGGRGEVDGDAVGVQQVHDLVEPLEGVLALRRLEPGPGEDPEGHEADPRLAHQPHVVVPDGTRPLLGVVVPTEGDPVVRPSAHARQSVDVSNKSQHFATRPPGASSGGPAGCPRFSERVNGSVAHGSPRPNRDRADSCRPLTGVAGRATLGFVSVGF